MTPVTVRSLAIVTVVGALALTGCGRKGSPVSPEQRAPAAIAEFTGVARPDGIELRWTNPTRRADGRRLYDLVVVRVFRTEDAGVGPVRPALVDRGKVFGYSELATITIRSPAPATIQGNRMTLLDKRGLAVGKRYTYVVIAGDSEPRWSASSPRVTIGFAAAPDRPRDLAAEAGDGEVRLRWQAPAQLTDGSAVSGTLSHEVLRAGSEDAELVPIARTLGTESTFVDRGLENERAYYYAVRAIHTDAGTSTVGEPTPRVSATPVDVTPPSAPTNLAAVVSERAVRLAWRPSPEPDVAFYVVYRATGTGEFQRIGSARPPSTVFLDRAVASGRYRYVVTAEDTSARRNESPRSNEVSVTVP